MLTIFQNFFSPPRHLILLMIAAWFGLTFAEKRAQRHGVNAEDLNNLVFYGMLGLVIGGRVAFVLENLPAFLKSPLGIFSINPDLFDVAGGCAAAAIVGAIYGQRRGLKFWSTLDALTPFFATLAVGLGLSHLAAGTSFGKETSQPIGIKLWNATRHPTQIYETVAALITLALILRPRENPAAGLLFLSFAALTAFANVIIPTFRADAAPAFSGIKQAQIVAWFTLAACFILFEIRLKEREQHG